ncbi:MAG: UDP-2,3-diacylglucosamine diphosphatase [Alphaproteobacteria bacterium]|nr:UDP-2,3-diacylglucosamine diphosphatase [Alphaproteobacteria bacterium]
MTAEAIYREAQISLAPPLPCREALLSRRGRLQQPQQHRSMFLSDMHLGTRMCRPDLILSFLDAHRAETVYLVGDIVDNWHPLTKNWSAAHHQVLRRLLDLPQTGSRVVYLPGNHDAFFRAYVGGSFGGIEVERDAMHQSADGRRLLVTHGDQCDVFARRAPVLARLGSLLETGARSLDVMQRKGSRAVGLSEWNGITRQISRSNALIRGYDRFEERLCDLARERGADGIVCGHFHQPALREQDGCVYANCGDWTEHGTGLVEGFDGALRLLSLSRALPLTVHQDACNSADDGLTRAL